MNDQPKPPTNSSSDDFWDLGDDDLDLESPAPVPAPVQPAPPAPIAAETSKEPSEPTPSPQPVAPANAEAPLPKRVRVTDVPREVKPTTVFEKISLGVVITLLMAIVAWAVNAFSAHAPNPVPPPGFIVGFIDDYPISGQSITVESVETWWTEPVREGENVATGVSIDAALIPCAKITIANQGSQKLQVSFRDIENNLIGDIINLEVRNGSFVSSGSQEATVQATAGFNDASMINAYVNGDIYPWSLVINEGEDAEVPLVKARIEANRKEN